MKTLLKKRVRALLALGFFLSARHLVVAVPVIPGAVGYGTDTVAARNIASSADIYRVKNLNDSGPDSLRFGLEDTTWKKPRVIIFDVSGVIELQSELKIRPDSHGAHGYVTVAGQTAPFPGITLKNFGIITSSHDVLIQHIAVRPGNVVPAAGPIAPNLGYDNKDALRVESTTDAVHQIVFDHVSCSWAMDETASVYPLEAGTAADVTFIDCIFADPILNGEVSGGQTIRGHSKGTHGYGVIVGPNTEKISLVRNLMAFQFSRNPLIRSHNAGGEVVNNLIYRPGPYSSSGLQIGELDGGSPNAVAAIGNVFIRNPAFSVITTAAAYQAGTPPSGPYIYPVGTNHNFSYTSPIVYVNDDVVAGAGLFSFDNTLYNPVTSTWGPPGGDQWHSTFFQQQGGPAITHLGVNPYPNSGGTTWSPLPNAQVQARVQASAGKFPFRRDAIDAALLGKVTTNTGTFLERLGSLGADPWASVDLQTTRALPLPASPTANSDGDSYKDFEEWLHGMSNWVEGLAAPTTLDAALTSFDAFTDGNANGWTPLGYTDWSVSGGIYKQSYDYHWARAVMAGTNWTNQVVQAKIKPLSFVGSDRFIALLARQRDADNFYYLSIRNAPSNTIEIKKSVNGTPSVVGATSYSFTPTVGVSHTFRLEVSGTTTVTLKAFLDGAQILSVTDGSPPAQLASGPAAIGTYYATADFDDVFASPFPTDVPQVMSDFDTGSTAGWTPAAPTNVWTATSGVYHCTDKTVVAPRTVAGSNASAQTVQADVRILDVNTTDRFAAIYARYTDVNNGYYLLLRKDQNKVELKKVSGGTPTLIDDDPQTVNLNQWYTLRLEVSATGQLKGYVNGVLRVSGTDNTLAAGKAALGTNLAAADFDDVIVTSP